MVLNAGISPAYGPYLRRELTYYYYYYFLYLALHDESWFSQ